MMSAEKTTEVTRACGNELMHCTGKGCETCGWNPAVDAARRAKPIEWIENWDGTKSVKIDRGSKDYDDI